MSPEAIIEAICPALFADPNMATYIELATLRTGDCFGVNRNQAIALRAAHMYTIAQRTAGAAGPITSLSESKVSISYGAGGALGKDAGLAQTSYGSDLLDLIRAIPTFGVASGLGFTGGIIC